LSHEPESVSLLYITYHENILYSGILRGQVQKMLEGLLVQSDGLKATLLCYINPYQFWRDRGKWRELKQTLANDKVKLIKLPLLLPSRWHWQFSVLSLIFCLIPLWFILRGGKYNVVHSRSYFAGMIAQWAKKLTGARHVFDPRGPFAEEGLQSGFWHEGDSTHNFWLKVERELMCESDAVVAVTPDYKRAFIEFGARKVVFVPNRGDVRHFAEQSKQTILPETPVMLFFGGMDGAWYHPSRVGQFYLALKADVPDLKLKLISRANPQMVADGLGKVGVAESDWTLESRLPEEMPEHIASGTFGLMLGLRPSGNWPVKFAEYMACGVPVVVEELVGKHITVPVEKWGLGIVVDMDDEASFKQISGLISVRTEYSQRCREFALKRLDMSRSSAQYARLYRQLLELK